MKYSLLLGVILIMSLLLSGCGNQVTGNAIVNSEDEFVKIPISEITSTMKRYSHDSNGITVNYFAVKGSDDEIRTAFDACDVCGGHQGYRQQGQDVVCNKCGRFFNIDDLGTKNTSGGCWPSYLDHTIEGDNILIKKSELDTGAFRFR